MMTVKTGLTETCTVAVVGGGTSGLALAAELKRLGVDSVVVIEREQTAGGIPRHCGHYPFGVREYGRLLRGPDYARKNVENAVRLGVDVRVDTTVTALHPGGRLSLSTRRGQVELNAGRVVLCTGVRESSRAQRFIGGDRPMGVMSTGALQSLVYLQGMRPFRRPVILGSELVSFSAIETCRHLGIRPLAMIEEQNRIIARKTLQPYLTFRGVGLYVNAVQPKIIGRDQVEAIEFTDPAGHLQRIETDGVIISGRFRPESALLRQSHLEVDPHSGGPVIDQFGQCSDPAYYSAGNLLRPAETSGWCWHEGVATAKRIFQEISAAKYEIKGSARFRIKDKAIGYVVPQRLSLCRRPGGMDRLQIGLNEAVKGDLEATSEGRLLWKGRIHSRPVRRCLMPLPDIIDNLSGTDVELSVQRRRIYKDRVSFRGKK